MLDEAFALDDPYLPAVAHGWQDADWMMLEGAAGTKPLGYGGRGKRKLTTRLHFCKTAPPVA